MSKKLKYPLVSQTCVACNMELLPYLKERGNGSFICVPDMYCDDACKRLHKRYPLIFGKGYKERQYEELGYSYK